MKTQIIAGVLGIFLISCVTAIYSGESMNLTLPEEYSYYSILGNNTPIYLEIEQNGLNLTITFDKYQESDEFELIFFNQNKKVITVSRGGGGGGTRTKHVNRAIFVPSIEIVEKEDNDFEEIECGDGSNNFWSLALLWFLIIFIFGMYILLLIKRYGKKIYKKK